MRSNITNVLIKVFFLLICIEILYQVHLNLLGLELSIVFIAGFGASLIVGFTKKEYLLSQMIGELALTLVSALVGVVCSRYFGLYKGLVIGMIIVLVLNSLFGVTYPPSGALCMIPFLSQEIQVLEYWYVITPTLTGIFIIQFITSIQIKISKQYGKS